MFYRESPQWIKGLRLPAWLSFLLFFTAMVLYFTAFFGHSWYVVPKECVEPATSYQNRQGRTCHLNFGLFRLCHRGHCHYNLRVDYMVVGQIPYKEIQEAYERFLTPVQVLLIVAFLMASFALATFLAFLSAFSFSPFMGFFAAGFQILSGILVIVGGSLFGKTFRGPTDSLPFGWSFWMAIIAACVFIINGVFVVFVAMAAFLKYMRAKGKRESALAGRLGFMAR